MTFGAYKFVQSEPFLDYLYELWQLLSALYSDVRKFFFIKVHIYILGPKLLQWTFFKSLSYLYEVVGTNFSADFWTFSIFDCNFAKIVAPT